MSAQTAAGPQMTPQQNAPSLAVRVERLVKTYDARPALRAISFSVPVGATFGIFGPNGAGKSTLLRTLATLTRPTSGSVQVCGYDAVREAHEVRLRAGYAGHQPHTYEDLTARENLRFVARMYGMRDGAERAEALLERVGLRAKAGERADLLARSGAAAGPGAGARP